MTTKNLFSFIICTGAFIYCTSCGEQKTGTGKTSKASGHNSGNSSHKDPRTIGGQKSAEQVSIDEAKLQINAAAHPILGYWVGAFGTNRINITLSHLKGAEIKGYSVCAGNYRPISGTITSSAKDVYAATLKEPGDNKYDGTFEFTINTAQNELKGKWTPFKKKGNVAKTYTLHKKDFVYNPKAGDYPQTSETELTEADVENMTPEDLEMMRNEIYARHGYSFKNKAMRAAFESKDWYMPMGVDIRSELTDIEAKNIELIYRYEEYYKTNYDDYGR